MMTIAIAIVVIKFKCASILIQYKIDFSSTLPWLYSGLLTGLVIDSGDGVTHVVNYARTISKWDVP